MSRVGIDEQIAVLGVRSHQLTSALKTVEERLQPGSCLGRKVQPNVRAARGAIAERWFGLRYDHVVTLCESWQNDVLAQRQKRWQRNVPQFPDGEAHGK
jgi:hypothetical protein